LRQKIHPRKICHLRGRGVRASACIVDVIDTFSNSLKRNRRRSLIFASAFPVHENARTSC
jgi:hypothetical protein